MSFDTSRFLAAVGDAVLAVDREGRIRFWNAAAERMFGYGADEAIGASLDLIIPERHRDRHWQAYYRVMETGKTKLGPDVVYATARRRSGEEMRVAIGVGVLRLGDDSIEGIGAIMRECAAEPPRGSGGAGARGAAGNGAPTAASAATEGSR